jgi:hypothetical protein
MYCGGVVGGRYRGGGGTIWPSHATCSDGGGGSDIEALCSATMAVRRTPCHPKSTSPPPRPWTARWRRWPPPRGSCRGRVSPATSQRERIVVVIVVIFLVAGRDAEDAVVLIELEVPDHRSPAVLGAPMPERRARNRATGTCGRTAVPTGATRCGGVSHPLVAGCRRCRRHWHPGFLRCQPLGSDMCGCRHGLARAHHRWHSNRGMPITLLWRR